MAIADQLTLLNTTKTNIKAAIEAKGVTVGTVPFADYPSKIALIEGGGGPPTPAQPTAWVRPKTWPTVNITKTDTKLVGLYAVWPNSGNLFSIRVYNAFTVDFGDGTVTNYASGTKVDYIFDYSSAALVGTEQPVTFTAATNTVNKNAHGFVNGDKINFYNITNTTGILESLTYYVINATTDSFQVSLDPNGSAVILTNDGSATLLPYRIAVVTITPQSGQTLNEFSLDQRHSLRSSSYSTNWLEFSLSGPNLTIFSFNTSNVVNWYLQNVRILSTPRTNFGSMFNNCRALKNVEIDSDILPVQCNSMFVDCHSLESVPLFNTQNATTMQNMFQYCYSLVSVPLFNTQNVTNMGNMFNLCYALREIPQFNTQNVTDMQAMFSICQSLEKVPSLNTVKVTNMFNMFNGCRSLYEAPMLVTSAVTSMSSMFASCESLVSVPLYNTQNVTDMGNMFSGCQALISVPLFDTQNVTNMSNMFRNCDALTEVPNFNTAKVTGMFSMFNGCESLFKVPKFNTQLVTTMAEMFNGCVSLETVPLFDTQNVTNMNEMFVSCNKLKTIPQFNTSKVVNMNSTFAYCRLLESVPDLDTTLVTSMSGLFNNCQCLREVPDLYMNAPTSSSGYSNIFGACSSLSRIRAKEFRWTFSVANCNLGPTELNEIYTNLPTVTGQTITVSGNWGTATDDPTIATAKGWTVTG